MRQSFAELFVRALVPLKLSGSHSLFALGTSFSTVLQTIASVLV